MDRKLILDYVALFKDLGMLFNDAECMILLKNHIGKTFYQYEMEDLFRAYMLISHIRMRDMKTLKVIEDAIKIRVGEQKERENVSAESAK